MELEANKKKQLSRAVEMADGGTLAIAEYINEVETGIRSDINNIVYSLQSDISRIENKASIPGEKGDKPIAGIDFEVPKDGKDYVLTDNDKQEIATIAMMDIEIPIVEKTTKTIETIKEIPIVTEKIIEKAVTDVPDVIVDKINVSSKKISQDRVEGLELLKKIPEIERISKINSEKYALPVTTTFFSQDGGVKGRAKNINIVGGTVSIFGDTATITFTSSGGGSLTEIVISGTIDDSNTSFTAASQPNYLVINGVWYKPTGGAYTWSYLAGVITLSNPIGTGGQIWGF